MQINNNVQSPNFGMALKISKGAKAALKELPMDSINRIQKAGAELVDTKFYHVEIDDKLTPRLTADKDAYFGLFKTKDFSTHHGIEKGSEALHAAKNVVMIDDNKTRRTVVGVARYMPEGETKPIFNVWGATGSYNEIDDVLHLSSIARILDATAVEKQCQKITKETAAKQEYERVSRAVNNLLDEFGV